MRRWLTIALFAVCVAGVIGYQATRPAAASPPPNVFVPSAQFFERFSPSFRTSIADAYWLYAIQYYGEHLQGDQRFDSLWPLLDLVTRLSPQFVRAYLFGSFALDDAGRPDLGYKLLQRGYAANSDDWHIPALLGFFAYRHGSGAQKNVVAAQWYEKAAELPGRPAYVPRLAALLMAKGGEREKAMALWAQVYADGDKYSRQKAVEGLDQLLSTAPATRRQEVAALREYVPGDQYDAFASQLLGGY